MTKTRFESWRTLAEKALSGRVQKVLATLDPREEKVLRLRFGLGDGERLSLSAIAARLSISKERVRQIEVRAFEKLQSTMLAAAHQQKALH